MTATIPYGPGCLPLLGEALRRHWLLAFDFDGTLAPFVADPATAAIAPEAFADLAILAGRRPVAVISGRSRRDLRTRIPVGVAYLVGNHGCEAPDSDPAILEQARRQAAHWRFALTPPATALGFRVEDKGPSLALHWRGHPDPDAEQHATRLALELVPRPHLIAGDRVLNLLPPGLPDKGVALVRLRDRIGCPGAVFIGDDITDAAVFRLHDPRIIGIEVGDRGLGASWQVPDVAAVHALIREMLALTGND